ncbi:MAG: 1,4-beta-xylanase [Flavobacteriaceae bacterium]|nr:1,4-beta-xylanase [Flavobacteriaceae bacterium]
MIIKSCNSNIDNPSGKWTEERAWEWNEEQPWLVGTNFISSSAINQLEFWQEDTFDPDLIDKELELSASIGMNTHRVFLHDLLWEQDSIGFIKRIDQYLSISEKHGIKTMLVFFDDVWNPKPKLGKQPEPIPNVHNSGWVQSPGAKLLRDTLAHGKLESYVKGVLENFANDERVLIWDLYNEPGQVGIASYEISKERTKVLYNKIGVEITDENYPLYDLKQIDDRTNKKYYTLQLLKKVVRWARDINPSQPITSGIYDWNSDWGNFEELSELDQFILSSSDIISFHEYGDKTSLIKRIEQLNQYNRPLMCTEYLNRGNNSGGWNDENEGNTFYAYLPLFKKHKVAAYNWGFVSGKTNTIYPWKSWDSTYSNPPTHWHHDVFDKNLQPFSKKEVEFIQQTLLTFNNP